MTHCLDVPSDSYNQHNRNLCDRLSVVLKRTVVGDRHLNNLSGNHLQSQVNRVCQSVVLQVWSA